MTSRDSHPVLAATLLAGAVLAALLSGCEPPPKEIEERSPVPPDLEIVVLNPDRPEPLRCTPDVRIGYKVPDDVLKSVTLDLRDETEGACERFFATYYLPYMSPGGGAWATVELAATAQVTLLGLSAGEEAELVAAARKSHQPIAMWVDDTSYATVLTVFERNHQVWAERRHRDHETVEEEVSFGRYQGRTGFEERGGNDLGRYYVVARGGNLETHDDGGAISVARLVRLDRDLDRLIVDVHEHQKDRAAQAATRRERVAEAAGRERAARWYAWLSAYQETLEPLRHPILRLSDGLIRGAGSADCVRLVEGLPQVSPSVARPPSPALDMAGLEEALGRVASACEDDRRIQVMVEARSAAAYWREIDRTLGLLAYQYRRAADDDAP